LIKVEICDRKKKRKTSRKREKRYLMERIKRKMVNWMCYPPADAGIRTMETLYPSHPRVKAE